MIRACSRLLITRGVIYPFKPKAYAPQIFESSGFWIQLPKDKKNNRIIYFYMQYSHTGVIGMFGTSPAAKFKSVSVLWLSWARRVFYIYIYAFSRRFYPKRLTVHSGYTFFLMSMCVPWELNPQPSAMLYHWVTGTPFYSAAHYSQSPVLGKVTFKSHALQYCITP